MEQVVIYFGRAWKELSEYSNISQLREYAHQNGYKILQEYTEEPVKEDDECPVFLQMMGFITNNPDCKIVMRDLSGKAI